MEKINRRVFLKATALTGTAIGISGIVGYKKSGLPDILSPAQASPAKTMPYTTVVSDVDAHSQCTMNVRLKDGRVVRIMGNPTDPESKGALTTRGQHMQDILYAPDRLLYPMKRTGERGEGKWKQITWDEALETIADKLNETKRKYGAEAIDFHHGHYHSGDILGSYLPRLSNLIGTPNVSNVSHVCHLPRVLLQYNIDFGMVAPPDVTNTECLIVWGGNPATTNKPQDIAINEARKRGMKLIVVDPRSIPYCDDADIHARPRPGTDGALALGMLHVIIKEDLYDHAFVEKWTLGFDRLARHIEQYTPEKVSEITWVPAETIRTMARIYATTKPASISPRNALDQHTNAACAIRAINILMAITGNLDIKGGNIFLIPLVIGLEDLKLYDKLPAKAKAKKLGADTCLYSKISETWPSAHTPALWDAILHDTPYPLRAMFVMSANPMLTCENTNIVEQALRKLDFLVVADMFMTPTAELADIVLPACTFLEKTRFVTYDVHADHAWNKPLRIALSPKVVEPLGESRSDWKIICELARKMGFAQYFPWKTEEEAIDHVIAPYEITCEDLKEHPEGIFIPAPSFLYKKLNGFPKNIVRSILTKTKFADYPEMYRKYEARGFMTPSGKVEIYSEKLEKLGYDPLPVYAEPAESPISTPELAKTYPLILIAGSKLEMYTHSMMRNIPSLNKKCPENLLEINPHTAAGLGIGHGEMVRISSPRGNITCRAYLTDEIDRRVVHLYHGFAESNCNVLTDHKVFDPITGATGMKSLLCRVDKI